MSTTVLKSPGVAGWLTIIACAALVVGDAIAARVGFYDQGFAMTNAWRLLQGELPHRDFWAAYPPGSAGLLALAYAAFEPSVAVTRAVHALWGLVLVGALAMWLFRVASQPVAMLALAMATVWYCAGIYPAYAAGTGLALAALSLALLAGAVAKPAVSGALLAGTIGGVLVAFRHDFAAYLGLAAALALAALWLRHRRHCDSAAPLRALTAYLVALAVVAGGILLALALTVGWSAFWEQAVVVPATVMRANRALPVPPLIGGFAAGWRDWLMAWSVPLALLALLPMLVATWRSRPPATATFATVAWTTTAFFTQQAFSRLDLSHVAPSAVLLLATMATLSPGLAAATTAALRPAAALAAAAGLLVVTATAATALPALNLGHIAHCLAKPKSARCMSVDAEALEVARRVREATSRGDPVFVGNNRHDLIFVNDALMYFLLQRPIPVPWNEMHPGIVTTAAVQSEIVRRLDAQRVRIAVIATMPEPSEPNDSSIPSGVSLLDDYLRQNFSPQFTLGRYVVLERMAPEATSSR